MVRSEILCIFGERTCAEYRKLRIIWRVAYLFLEVLISKNMLETWQVKRD